MRGGLFYLCAFLVEDTIVFFSLTQAPDVKHFNQANREKIWQLPNIIFIPLIVLCNANTVGRARLFSGSFLYFST